MKDHKSFVILGVLAFVLATQPAGAEVMDKELSLKTIWLWAATGAVAGLLGCCWRAWIAIISLPLALAAPVAMILELREPYVGKAMIEEGGKGYVAAVYAATFVVVLAHMAGVIIRIQRKRRREPRTNVWSGRA